VRRLDWRRWGSLGGQKGAARRAQAEVAVNRGVVQGVDAPRAAVDAARDDGPHERRAVGFADEELEKGNSSGEP
jgi:hypothetical protein